MLWLGSCRSPVLHIALWQVREPRQNLVLEKSQVFSDTATR